MHPCLFLDRDGIINEDFGYVHRSQDCQFCPGIFKLCRYFQDMNFKIIVVTNQSGIGRGYYSSKDLEVFTDYINKQFQQRSIHITHTYFCPHLPEDNCDCRKPKPGMLLKAQNDYQIAMHKSIMLGDKKSDVLAGKAANIKHLYWLNKENKKMDGCYSINNLEQVIEQYAHAVAHT